MRAQLQRDLGAVAARASKEGAALTPTLHICVRSVLLPFSARTLAVLTHDLHVRVHSFQANPGLVHVYRLRSFKIVV
jgi:hypothetical protein